jgi:hypothetical protein
VSARRTSCKTPRVRPRYAIVFATALVFAISAWLPMGHELLYPLTLLATWVHEMGHGMTALAVGGEFTKLEIFRDASGLASAWARPGWPEALVALGGLLAPPIVGAAILGLVHGPRRARVLLAGMAVALVVSLAVFVRSATGVIAMPVVAVVLAWAAWGFKSNPEHRVVVAQVLAVVFAFDTLTRMVSYVFMSEVEVDGEVRHSDIQNVADNLGGHYMLWGAAVTAIAVGMLALGLWRAWRRPGRST